MVVPITDVVKMTLSVANVSVEPIIGTPLVHMHVCLQCLATYVLVIINRILGYIIDTYYRLCIL